MVVEPDSARRSALEETLRAPGHVVEGFEDAQAALAALAHGNYDVVMANVNLERMSGTEFLRGIAARAADVVAIMVADEDSALAGLECLKAGAVDYVTRPFKREDLLWRIGRAVERHSLLDESRSFRHNLEMRLAQSSQNLRRLLLGAVESLASALEARDPNTRGHSQRVADLATAMALPMRLSEQQRERLHVAGLLHDIGKIGIPDDILQKPGRLTRRERAQIEMHPLIAVSILSPVLADSETVAIIRHHHERIDGAGYPDGLGDDDIPLGARILAAADAFDAMTSKRPYRAAYSREQALDEMRRHAGLQLDTEVVGLFHMLLRRCDDGRGRDHPAPSP